ncbi:MAG: AAA family ATPase [Helicobacteraceae bacterium]|nr:AAA family ATPase [Helicobacteraceae bacterium]
MFGQLNHLKINGYKSIKSLDLELKPLNIIIGSNGVGKSNFIGFFKFMKKIIDKDLQFYTAQQGGANKILCFGSQTTDEINFNLTFDPNGYSAVLVPGNDDNLIFKQEKTSIVTSAKNFLKDNFGGKESNLPNNYSANVNGFVVEYINDWKVYHFHDTSATAKVKQTCNIKDYRTLASDGANIAAFLLYTRDNNEKSYTQIVKTIQRVAPFFHDFKLEPEINNPETIKLKWKHKGTDDYFDANDLSDGTLRFICLTTLLLQPNLPKIILLDEPELGLHPFALILLASMFRKVSKKTQIIASTQSVTLADNFDIEDIIIVDRVDNYSKFKRLNKNEYKDWLEEYSLGEIWQKNLIGGVPTYD